MWLKKEFCYYSHFLVICMIYWGPWLYSFLDLLHFEVWWASTSWDICFCFVPGHWRESITCFSSINVTDLNVQSSIHLHSKGNKFFKKCSNFFPNLHSEGVIVKKLLCPKKIPTVFTIFPWNSPLTYFDILEQFRQ